MRRNSCGPRSAQKRARKVINLRIGEDHLAVRYVQKEGFPHPFSPFLKTLGMAGGAESPGPAGKHDEPLLPALGTPDSGKPAARVAAVQVALDDFLNDRPEEAVLLLEAALVFSQEALQMMEDHPVEDRALRMPGTIDSRQGGRNVPRNGPTSRIRPDLLEKTPKAH